MYRRIELINHTRRPDGTTWSIKVGLMSGNAEVVESGARINIPRQLIFRNVRFFFTEAGWNKYGRATVAACQRTGQDYRVIACEEHDPSIEVTYRDEYQVAVRPRKGRRRSRPGREE